MNISYAITVCDEFVELRKLLSSLTQRINLGDEIIILIDSGNFKSEEIKNWLDTYNSTSLYNIKIHLSEFKGDFAKHKNLLNSYCSCDYIFQIDADELPPDTLIRQLPKIIETYPSVDLYYVPRINIVENITLDYVKSQRWNISKLDTFVDGKNIENVSNGSLDLLTHYNLIISNDNSFVEYYEPIVNLWDYQSRIYKNSSNIEWVGNVHETIKGSKQHVMLPANESYALYHYKSFEKQQAQNNFYESL